MNWQFLKSVLFKMDPERAHTLTVSVIHQANRFFPGRLRSMSHAEDCRQTMQALGMRFRSPVGLAAGFDKNAELIEAMPNLGFGFVEVGTVTPRPQSGNPRPRLYRYPEERALFNQMGFNNDGVDVIANRLKAVRSRARLPKDFRVGVNIGKNKDTPQGMAALDYRKAAEPLQDLADYLVINVSSPNTPGLRDLQQVETLTPIIGEVREVIDRWPRTPPLLLKFAPEIDFEANPQLITELESTQQKLGIDAWIVTNTLGDEREGKRGGLSGEPLRQRSRAVLKSLRALTQADIISVGGIMDPKEAGERLKLGANLVQIYSGWIYAGPELPAAICREIKQSFTN